jgi:hypothetical protein
MIKKRRPATSGQEREALIKMAADESELSRKTGNYKEQSTAGVSARAKKYIEPVVETALTVMPLGGTVIGAAKMIPTIVKGAAAAAAKRAAAAEAKRKAAAEAKRKAAAEAKRKAEKKLQEENIYEESTRRVDPIPPTSGAGRPSSPGGVQTKSGSTTTKSGSTTTKSGSTTTKPKGDTTIGPIPATAAGLVAVSPFVVPGKRGNVPDTSPKKGQPGSKEKPIDVATLKITPSDPSNPPAAVRKSESPAPAKFDSEPDPREDPSAWRKWNFKRVKAAEKAGVKPESIAKSSLDKEISERNMYDVSDKKGGRIKTSPKVKRAVGGMVKPKKKTSSPRGAGCAQRGYGKAMMGGGKVKAYKAGGKVGGNRLY